MVKSYMMHWNLNKCVVCFVEEFFLTKMIEKRGDAATGLDLCILYYLGYTSIGGILNIIYVHPCEL